MRGNHRTTTTTRMTKVLWLVCFILIIVIIRQFTYFNDYYVEIESIESDHYDIREEINILRKDLASLRDSLSNINKKSLTNEKPKFYRKSPKTTPDTVSFNILDTISHEYTK